MDQPIAADSWQEIRLQVLKRDDYRCVSCSTPVKSAQADVHHLLPRSMGGTDELANLVTLCDGCHAVHHPNLAGGLARRVIERWAVRLARWLDTEGQVSEGVGNFGPALRLFEMDRFRQGQLPIVLAALSGKSVLVVSPTGSGKTLCFQLPAMLRRGLTMVVSPLKTLMSEQVSDLLAKKIPATFINSDLSVDEKQTRFSLLGRGAIKLLYLAPERFFVRSEDERASLKQTRPSFIVVDEAHCVDQWGRDFRREYGRLKEVREKLGAPPVLAFTATAGREMQQRILKSLGIEDAEIFVRDVDRPNIALLRWRRAADQRAGEIASLLRIPQLQGQKAMVFVPSTKVGEELQAELRNLGLEVPLYHSRLGNAWERQELVKRFLGQSRPPVDQIICTNAFGMGLDVPNVRLVIHWQQPASVEDQLQEFGRAGRDGKPSVAVMFHNGSSVGRDISRLRFMAEKTVEAAQISALDREHMLEQRYHQIDQVSELMKTRSCMRTAISEYFQGPKTTRRPSFSVWILDWAFGTRTKSRRFRACCDHCDKAEIRRHGMAGYVARVIAG
ncbi:RecQ family ATP-dependent DNA helicase [Mesorhizobium sp.]|uniref:RecQ family ATP-dependent DNA helicase n=1 Tax=Mesorhizobium sp. TaxID=1871066 RepID=UPI00120AF849|nr:RecQ family ATP-dependent DNA helicase [Mesorhizobium sp.]TIS99169.1 MAG: RecQ family ATP-dependent DNA helicase [Mesorhizobium sp.]